MTATAFTPNGKQVLHNGLHFADATCAADAERIAAGLNGSAPNRLERDAIATGLRAIAVLHTEVAAGAEGSLRKTFLDGASLVLKAAKELSHG